MTGLELCTGADGNASIRIDPEVDYGFDLTHLWEHLDSGEAVSVAVDPGDTTRALAILDAPVPVDGC